MTRRKSSLPDIVREQLEAAEAADPRWAPLAALRDRLPPEGSEPRARRARGQPEPQAGAEALEARLRALEAAEAQARERARAFQVRLQEAQEQVRALEVELGRLGQLRREAEARASSVFPEVRGEAQTLLAEIRQEVERLLPRLQEARERLRSLEADPLAEALRQEEARARAQAAAREAAQRAKEMARKGDITGALKALQGHEGPEVEALRAMVADEARHRAREALRRARGHLRDGQPQEAMSLLEEAVPAPALLGPEDRRAIHGAYLAAARAAAPEGAVFAWVGEGGVMLALPAGKDARVLRGLGIPWRAGTRLRPRTLRVRPLREQQPVPASGEAS